jgi:hypothetical protein
MPRVTMKDSKVAVTNSAGSNGGRSNRSVAVKRAAAQVAVKASAKTGRAVDARVKKIAESR